MISKNEILKLLKVAQEEKIMLQGKIELLVNQMRMISQKELAIEQEKEKKKVEEKKVEVKEKK